MLRVFHVNLRPCADRNTPGLGLQADDAVLLQIARGDHPAYHLVHAADVQDNDLEAAYVLTNTIDKPWFLARHPLITPSGLSRRSTSVNDLILDGKAVKVVRSIGFARLAIRPDELKPAELGRQVEPA